MTGQMQERTKKPELPSGEAGLLAAPSSPVPNRLRLALRKSARSPVLHLLLLIGLSFLCWGKTLTTYFLADDIGEINYVYLIFHGHADLFWSNFVGNYMQIPGMNVYRPFLMTSLVFDYLVYKSHAWGYYLTNFLYFTGCVLLIYLLARALSSSWGQWRQAGVALLSAGLFCASPLRCESVSWVLGRVDVICGFYFLLSLYSFLICCPANNRRRQALLVLSVVSFWLGILTKEMAVGLPVLATLAVLLRLGQEPAAAPAQARLGQNWLPSALRAGQSAWPLWVSFVTYFGLRILFLGTASGGYTAGFGASQLSHMIERWFDIDTILRLAYPLNSAIFATADSYGRWLSAAYIALTGLVLSRLILGRWPGKILCFLSVWVVVAVLPIFQLWGLGLNLEGGRFYYFLAMPLSLTLPVLLFCPIPELENSPLQKINDRVALLSLAALLGLLYLSVQLTEITNMVWVQAGREVHRFHDACLELANQLPSGKRAIVLGIPDDKAGAHMILNASTFDTLLSQPFVDQAIADKFVPFAPIMFGKAERIQGARLRAAAQDSGTAKAMVWNSDKERFESMPWLLLPQKESNSGDQLIAGQSATAGSLPTVHTQAIGHANLHLQSDGYALKGVLPDDGLTISGLHLKPLATSYLEFDLTSSKPDPQVDIAWTGPGQAGGGQSINRATAVPTLVPLPAETTVPSNSNSNSSQKIHPLWRGHVRVNLGNYWRWYTAPEIQQLTIMPGCAEFARVSNIHLLSPNMVAPRLTCRQPAENTGTIKAKNELSLEAQWSGEQAVTKIQFEVSKPNFFFDDFKDNSDLPIAERLTGTATQSSGQSSLVLSADQFKKRFPISAYYQVRARAIGVGGQPVGDYSQALTIKVRP